MNDEENEHGTIFPLGIRRTRDANGSVTEYEVRYKQVVVTHPIYKTIYLYINHYHHMGWSLKEVSNCEHLLLNCIFGNHYPDF